MLDNVVPLVVTFEPILARLTGDGLPSSPYNQEVWNPAPPGWSKGKVRKGSLEPCFRAATARGGVDARTEASGVRSRAGRRAVCRIRGRMSQMVGLPPLS